MLGDNAPKTEFTFGIGWVDAACAQARKYRDGLNSLNAFPVPDKDTGSNLTVTLTALKEAFDAEYEVLQKEPKPADAAALNLRIGQLYERAIMQAYRSARGNSGTLLCTWALEAVRSYWGLPGHLTEDMDESEVVQIPVFSALHQQYEEAPAAEPQALSSWACILQAVAAFDGKKPDDPTQTTGDPFPRARANRIVKLLADYVKVSKDDKARSECLGHVLKNNVKVFATQEQIDKDREEPNNDKRITKRCNHPICAIRLEWTDAQENARGTKMLVKALGPLPSKTRLDDSDEHTEDCIEQVRWLLDLIDLSGNLPDTYLALRLGGDADRVDPEEAADDSTAGGAQ